MCYSEKSSWISLILGTITNIIAFVWLIKIKRTDAALTILLWQYALFMQIPDGLAWRKIDRGQKPTSGQLAYYLNITQPFIAIIGTFLILKVSNGNYSRMIPALIFAIIYGISFISTYSKVSFDVSPEKTCNHLNYGWWGINSYQVILYGIVIILAIMAIPNNRLRIIQISLFLGTLLLHYMLSPKCPSGSLWCFLVAPVGLIILLLELFNNSPPHMCRLLL